MRQDNVHRKYYKIFYIDKEHPSASSMVRAYFQEGETPVEIVTSVTTVGAYVSGKSGLGRIGLVKIDVETSEGDVLSGMRAVWRETARILYARSFPMRTYRE